MLNTNKLLTSKEVKYDKIECKILSIKDFDDNIIVPHNYCNNSKELELLLIKIKKYPLLGKFYTLPYLMNLNEFMKNYNLNINLESIESFDQENILENILLLLERVVNMESKNVGDVKKNIDYLLIKVALIEKSLENLHKDNTKSIEVLKNLENENDELVFFRKTTEERIRIIFDIVLKIGMGAALAYITYKLGWQQ